MDTQPAPPAENHTVPWSLRETWFGVFFLFLFIGLAVVALAVIGQLGIALDIGLVLNLGELLFLLPIFWLIIKYNIGLDVFGLRRFNLRVLNLGFGLMVLVYLVTVAYGLILDFFGISTGVDLAPVLEEIGSPLPLIIAAVIAAPLVEELFFRGFLFYGLRQHFGWRWAALISTAFFALLHLQPANLLPIALLGFLFAYLSHISNSIWPAIILHAVFNGFNVLLVYIVIQNGLV
ncbi:MAG: CPBP family intramembrane metalloprotease [Chloroflexi bacterium]|nr:MAG: CPBP family intramembrane metalloprotease [Chloroflexota bacterium]MBL1193052.1 CPBP family intramembrane metalloprotease [Chloroflexota bacterium]NOH10345.1 CPBP family intramembrane metalloprotease [Chloroflexota bacterium]